MAALLGGQWVAAHPAWSAAFTWSGTQLAWAVMVYGFIASVLPVWLLLAPRDYLSAFLKIGTIVVLGTAIVLLMPPLKMPAVTQFIDGTGPVFAGKLFPFAFITIACGAISGFHALIASGTTPKMVTRESDARLIGYGSMLTESLVGLMAMIAAATLDPGVYFAMNVGPAILGTTAESASQAVAQWGFMLRPEQMDMLARQMGEASLLSRTGGAPSLAVMAGSGVYSPGDWRLYLPFCSRAVHPHDHRWTRVAASCCRAAQRLRSARPLSTRASCFVWHRGARMRLFHQGGGSPADPVALPLFRIANQLLAAVALRGDTVIEWAVRHAIRRAALVAGAATLTAGYQKVFSIAGARLPLTCAVFGQFHQSNRRENDLQRQKIDMALALFMVVVLVVIGVRAEWWLVAATKAP
jgi:carbon starvation protein